MIAAVEELGQTVGLLAACRALAVPRSSVYRARQAQGVAVATPNAPPRFEFRGKSPSARAAEQRSLLG